MKNESDTEAVVEAASRGEFSSAINVSLVSKDCPSIWNSAGCRNMIMRRAVSTGYRPCSRLVSADNPTATTHTPQQRHHQHRKMLTPQAVLVLTNSMSMIGAPHSMAQRNSALSCTRICINLFLKRVAARVAGSAPRTYHIETSYKPSKTCNRPDKVVPSGGDRHLHPANAGY